MGCNAPNRIMWQAARKRYAPCSTPKATPSPPTSINSAAANCGGLGEPDSGRVRLMRPSQGDSDYIESILDNRFVLIYNIRQFFLRKEGEFTKDDE